MLHLSFFSKRQSGAISRPLAALGVSLLACPFAFAQAVASMTEFSLTAGSRPQAIVAGSDGAMWFTDTAANSIGRIAPPAASSVTTFYTVPTPASGLSAIVTGPDGALWFTETNANQIGKLTTQGAFTECPLPTPASAPTGIVIGPDGALWFTESNTNKIGRISTAGSISELTIPTGASRPQAIATGDGSLWFTDKGNDKIGSVTTAGAFTQFSIPTANSSPSAIVFGTDQAYWFLEPAANQIASIGSTLPPEPLGVVTEYPIPVASSGVSGIVGAFGACFVEPASKQIGCVSPGGALKEYTPGFSSMPAEIATGPEGVGGGVYWVTEPAAGKIARVVLASASATPFAISKSVLPPGAVGSPYSASLTAANGTLPVTWSVVPGALPAGLSLSASGVISGTPTSAGSSRFTVTATDAASLEVGQTFAIDINPLGCTYALSSSGQYFPSVGGVGNFAVTTDKSCEWDVTGAPSWLHAAPVSGGPVVKGSGTVAYIVDVNPSSTPLSGTLFVADRPFIVQQQAGPGPFNSPVQAPLSYMPHLAAKGGWRTTFTLVNTSSSSAGMDLSLYGNDGNLLPLPLALPLQSSQSVNAQAWVDETLAPNQSTIITASGSAATPFVEGSAQLWASTPAVEGFVIFHYDPSGQEAVVPMGGSGFVIPFDNTNGVRTGIAIQSTAPAAATLPIKVFDENGNPIGTGAESITIAGDGHTSFILSTQFPITANIRGTAILGQCVLAPLPAGGYTNVCTKITTLGIRYTPPGTLTTIAPLNGSGGLMPHIASGAGWQTTFVLSNVDNYIAGPAAAEAKLAFFDDSGKPLSLPLTFLGTGASTSTSLVDQIIPANGTLWIQTSGDIGTALLTGSAQLSGVPGFAIFRYNPNGQEAVVPVLSMAGGSLLAFDNTNDTSTGVAISSNSSPPVTVPVVIRDGQGKQIGTSTISLAANGHTSFLLSTQFPVTSKIQGTIEFQNPNPLTPSPIAVLGIRSPPSLTFTTLPALAK